MKKRLPGQQAESNIAKADFECKAISCLAEQHANLRPWVLHLVVGLQGNHMATQDSPHSRQVAC